MVCAVLALVNYGWGGTDKQTDTHTHQYHDLTWPRGRAEWKKQRKTITIKLPKWSKKKLLEIIFKKCKISRRHFTRVQGLYFTQDPKNFTQLSGVWMYLFPGLPQTPRSEMSRLHIKRDPTSCRGTWGNLFPLIETLETGHGAVYRPLVRKCQISLNTRAIT